MPSLIQRLTRRKFVTFEDTAFERVLNLVDLTALGIGSTVGVGFYVLAGEVAKSIAGPAVTICFLIAAIASVFSGLCYAEFGARVPKSGSAYIYSYVCVGEFVAYIVGWNLILEYVIGTASVARGYSGYIDELANHAISDALRNAMNINVGFLSDYPDFLAFGLVILLTGVLCFGVKESSFMNNIFTLINLLVIAYVIFAGAIGGADVENWSIDEDELDEVCNDHHNNTGNTTDLFTTITTPATPSEDWGHGGFAPYGFAGIMRGAATCFFGFVGFDVIATTGEEAINPEKSIPLSIGLSLLFVFVAYFGMSAVITLAVPYCKQNVTAPLIYLFEYLDMDTAKWIVSIGALFGFSASLFGAMFPMPRIIYAMADDGLLFRILARVNKRFQTPINATIVTGIFAGIMALIFNLDSLVDMMSIGTLLAYTIVSLCVMLLRYASDSDQEREALTEEGRDRSPSKSSHSSMNYTSSDYAAQIFNTRGLKEPTDLSAMIASHATLVFSFLCFFLSLTMVLTQDKLYNGDVVSIVAVSILLALNILIVLIIARQPQSKKKLSFKVPFVPWLPAFSSFINLYLMCNLTKGTWIRFSVWMIIGFLIYFCYGMWKSNEEHAVSRPQESGNDNPGFEQGIPTINILPATPCPSQQGSTRSRIGARKSPAPISPLVRAELEAKEAAVKAEQEAKDAAAATADAARIIIDNNDNNKQGDEQMTEENVETQELQMTLDEDKVEVPDQKLTDLSSEGESNIRSNSVLEVQKVLDSFDDLLTENTEIKNEGKSLNHTNEVELEPARDQNKNISNTEVTDRISSAVNVNLEETKSEKDLEEKTQKDEDTKNKRDLEISTDIITEKDIKDEIDSEHAEVKKPKLEPIVILRESDKSEIPRIASAPVMSLSTPPPAPPPPPNSAGVNGTSSVPGTPLSNGRHPFKKLVRHASFDDIPPSLPNSPAAVRVRDKFILIPVQVPKDNDDSDDDNSNNSTSATTPTSDKQSSSVSPLSSPDLLSELKIKFKKDSSNEPETDSVTNDQFDYSIHSTNGRDLDTIRERGESKIVVDDLQSLQERRKSESKQKGMFYLPSDDKLVEAKSDTDETDINENKKDTDNTPMKD